VVAPFFHDIVPANVLASVTLEKNLGTFQSEQYAGTRVNKYALKLPTTNTEASFSADLIAQSVAILNSPTAVTVDPGVPFIFTNGSLSIFGNNPQITNVSLTIENTLKDTFTVQNQHTLQFLTATSRKVTGQFTAVFTSLNDTTWGYFNQMMPSLTATPVQGAISLTLAQPVGVGGSTWEINLPQVNLAKVGDEIKIGDIILQTFDFTASYQISSGAVLTSYIANSTNLPY
jgi:hypothetical protein